KLSEARAQCILAAVGEEPGTMAAVSGPLAQVRSICEGMPVALVNENAPTQGVIAGARAAVDEAIEKLSKAGLSAQRLQVACAFHSALLKGADIAFAKHLADLELRTPTLPVYANATAARYPESPSEVRSILASQLVSPVRFLEQVEGMYAAGVRLFVECGPGQVLTRLVGRILGERPHVVVSLSVGGKPGVTQLLEMLAELSVHGVHVQTAPLFAGRQARRLNLDAPVPAANASAWIVDGHRARPAVGELPAGALRPNDGPVAIPTGSFGTAISADREGTVLGFLQSMQQIADAQRDVMLRYLGAEVTAPAVRPAAQPERRAVAAKAPAATEKAKSDAGAPPPEAPAEGRVDVAQALLALVSERTGYPPEMLKLDADLEAELSIDSIKRIEILGVLTQKLGIPRGTPGSQEGLAMEKLAAVKTLRGIADFIEARMKGGDPAAAPASNGAKTANGANGANGTHGANGSHGVKELPPEAAKPVPLAWGRIEWAEAPAGPRASPSGKRYWLVPDAEGVAAKLADQLAPFGVEVLVQPSAPAGALHGFVDVGGLRAGREHLWPLFSNARQAIAQGATHLVAASGLGGRGGAGAVLPHGGELFGAGVAGLLKSLARERTELRVCAVDLDPAQSADDLAGALATEIVHADGATEVGWQKGIRRAP
ncbi:MAG TPA: acyltransferase domain-containing protein, partial [Gemmatimonadales bacterium]|nr:acyltransferase domain-containing protein [Gemmatimonadales bacterium]